MATMQSLHHHQVTSRFVEERPLPGDKAGTKHGFRPSEDQEWAIARRDTEGGTGYCCVCKGRFGVHWLVSVYRDPFKGEESICKFCQSICKYTRAR